MNEQFYEPAHGDSLGNFFSAGIKQKRCCFRTEFFSRGFYVPKLPHKNRAKRLWMAKKFCNSNRAQQLDWNSILHLNMVNAFVFDDFWIKLHFGIKFDVECSLNFMNVVIQICSAVAFENHFKTGVLVNLKLLKWSSMRVFKQHARLKLSQKVLWVAIFVPLVTFTAS